MQQPNQHKLVYLNKEEITMPSSVIVQFFNAADLPSHLKLLKQWRNAVAFETKRPKHNNAANLLYFHELTLKLLEAAWLLKHNRLGKLLLNNNPELCLTAERNTLPNYPKNLSEKELVNPSAVFKSLFKPYKLANYHEILKIWLHNALNTSFMEESLTKQEVIIVYEQLVKLFEVMWLINMRDNKLSIPNK